MTHRNEFLSTHPDFHRGMVAYSDDGQELGEVQKLDEDDLTIEKGPFFSRSRRLPYDAVEDIRADHLIINRRHAHLEEDRPEEFGWPESQEVETSVPNYQRDAQEWGKQQTDQLLSGEFAGRSSEQKPSPAKTGPMPGGESFRDETLVSRSRKNSAFRSTRQHA